MYKFRFHNPSKHPAVMTFDNGVRGKGYSITHSPKIPIYRNGKIIYWRKTIRLFHNPNKEDPSDSYLNPILKKGKIGKHFSKNTLPYLQLSKPDERLVNRLEKKRLAKVRRK